MGNNPNNSLAPADSPQGEASRSAPADRPDYYRILSDISRRNRGIKEDLSGRAGDMKEPEMTTDEFYRRLCNILPPRDRSDQTTFRKITGWVYRKCKYEGHREHELCARILDFAQESKKPPARNPRAVFISVLKKELGYPK